MSLKAITVRYLGRVGNFLLLLVVASSVIGGAYGEGDDELEPARVAMHEQEWSRAIRLLNRVVRRNADHLEARYLRGICYGERGKHPTFEKELYEFIQKGAQDFEHILARDSLYRDVLYQYALLRRFDRDYPAAIRLGHAQLRLKPDLAHAHVGLFKIYWRFIVDTDFDRAQHWLSQQHTDHATYFRGELYRRQGWFRAADEIFARLVEGTTTLTTTAVLLARARSHFAWNKPALAQAFMEQAIAVIETEADALILFDDIKYIVTPQELTAFNQIKEVAGYPPFFETFWVRRNPMPAASVNERLVEHYRRLRIAEKDYLFYGYRAWYNSPAAHDVNQFPPTFALSTDFDDRGIIFIRHGEPDDYTIDSPGNQVVGSWLYHDPLLVFHFTETTGGGSGVGRMTFAPIPTRSRWSGSVAGLDAFDMERKSGAFITEGLITDRHRWSEQTEFVDIPYMLATFRGQEANTLVELYYGMPLRALAEGLNTENDRVGLEVGMTLHDQSWRRVRFVRETKHLPLPDDQTALIFDRFQVDVPPDTYHVALHERSLQAPRVGAHTFGYRVPSYRQAGLKVSDVLLADTLIQLEDALPPSRDDLYIQVNADGRFRTDAPVFVYFEIYDLTLTPEGRTRYSLTYTLTPEQPTDLRRQPDRGGGGAIALTAHEQEGVWGSPIEYVAVDVSEVSPGPYQLTVTVRDEQTGDTLERSRALILYDD